jgi:hypothetical protein
MVHHGVVTPGVCFLIPHINSFLMNKMYIKSLFII